MSRPPFRFAPLLLPAILAALFPAEPARAEEPAKLRVYFGTYTRGESKGIYQAVLDLQTGRVSDPELAAELTNPSFLALHPTGRFLAAVGEISDFQGKRGGGVSSFAIDPASGALKLLSQQSSGGAGPCHVSIDATGRCVLVANYGGGSVASLPLDEAGVLGEAVSVIRHEGSSVNPSRQKEPHAHSINLDPANRFAFAADLGTDQVLVYRLDPAAASLTRHEPPFAALPPGSGPRHFAFHPSGRFAYVINELLSTVTSFSYDAEKGVLEALETVSTLPADFSGSNTTAEVQVHPSGKFLYGSNRGDDSLAIFAIEEKSGKLTPVGHASTGGKTPRNFGIDPTGRYVLAANQGTDNVVVLKVDRETGKLTPTGQELKIGAPVCVKFLPIK